MLLGSTGTMFIVNEINKHDLLIC